MNPSRFSRRKTQGSKWAFAGIVLCAAAAALLLLLLPRGGDDSLDGPPPSGMEAGPGTPSTTGEPSQPSGSATPPARGGSASGPAQEPEEEEEAQETPPMRGRVVSRLDGAPIPQARVEVLTVVNSSFELSRARFEGPAFRTATGADGAFALPSFPEVRLGEGGRYLRVSADGWETCIKSYFDLPEDEETVVRLSPGVIVEGTVLDLDGTPVPEAAVVAETNAFESTQIATDCFPRTPAQHLACRSFSGEVSDVGAYRIEGLPAYRKPGDEPLDNEKNFYEIHAITSDGRYGSATLGVVKGKTRYRVDVLLKHCRELTVLVPVPDGDQSLTNLRVFRLSDDRKERDYVEDFQDAKEGKIHVRFLQPALYQLIVSRTGFRKQTREVDLRTVPEATWRVTLDRGRVLTGRVVDEGGKPVAGAQVRAYHKLGSRGADTSVDTAGDGTFRMQGLPWGTLSLTVSAPRNEKRKRARFYGPWKLEAEENSVHLRLTPSMEWNSSRVKGSLDLGNLALEGKSVGFKSGGKGRISALKLPTAEDPRFEILAGDGAVIYFLVPSWPPLRLGPLAVGRGKTHDLGLLSRPQGRTLTGTVQNPDGTAADHADVVVDFDGHSASAATENGTYRVENLPLWKGRVRFSDGEGLYPKEYRGLDARATTLDVRFVHGGIVRGRVKDGDGKPVVKRYVWVVSADQASRQDDERETDGNGRFQTAKLKPGRYRVEVGRSDDLAKPVVAHVTVKANAAAEVEVVVPD